MSAAIPNFNDLATAAGAIPQSLRADIIEFLERYYFEDADLPLVSDFLNAMRTLIESPNFREMKDERQAEQHCIRCHDVFTEESNGPAKCIIPHVFDTEPLRTGEGDVYAYTSRCCGSAVQVEEEDYGMENFRDLDRLGRCYKGYHTADTDFVDERRYNTINIRRCKLDRATRVCRLKCIRAADPVFPWQVSK